MRRTIALLSIPRLIAFLAPATLAGILATGCVEAGIQRTNGERQAGDSIPDVVLRTAEGEDFDLAEAVAGQRTLLLFYRGGWCPFCSVQLSELAKVEADLRERGIQILAVSPDRPEKLRESRDNGDFEYRLLSDSDMTAARAFGIAYEVDPDLVETYTENHGIDLEAASGQTHHMLPHPAVYLVDADGVIRHAHVNPDYRDRLSGEELLQAAEALNR